MILQALTTITSDTTATASGGGFLLINWADNWINYIFYTIVGLLFTFLYFYFRKRRENIEDPDTWKCIWKKYYDLIIAHLVVYVTIIFAWIAGGGKTIFIPITASLKFLLSMVGLDITSQVASFEESVNIVMPKGELTWFVAFWGYFLTSIMRNWLPGIITWIKNKWFKTKTNDIKEEEDVNMDSTINNKKETKWEVK